MDLRWGIMLAVVLTAGCSDNPLSSSSATGVAARITLTTTLVSTGTPPTASIIATVRDSGEYPVSGVTVTFTTSEGFITSSTVTGNDGVATAMLTGSAGTAPTVTASLTSGDRTVSASAVVQF
jgi:hypothetical protein